MISWIEKYREQIIQHIRSSWHEDIGPGDYSGLSCIDSNKRSKAKLCIKEDGVIAGIELAQFIVQHFSKDLQFEPVLKDGDFVKSGQIAFYLTGSAQEILSLERLILNYMQRMSGIATQTAQYCDKIKSYKASVLDTRKTTPGFRVFEKWAVYIGGGKNHRFGLYDMIMIKDNHVDYAGGISQAIHRANDFLSKKKISIPIEIEVRNLQELDEVLQTGQVQRIMLDNFSPLNTQLAVDKIQGRYEVESSGGITLETIATYAACGVDFISVGALTHHIKSIDLSLKACD